MVFDLSRPEMDRLVLAEVACPDCPIQWKPLQVWFGYSGLVWLLRIGLATQDWFGYSGFVWLLRFGLATQDWFGHSGLVWLLRFGLAIQDWFGYSGLVWLLSSDGRDSEKKNRLERHRSSVPPENYL